MGTDLAAERTRMTHHPGQILDCIGRGNLTENQMMGMIQKIKREGLLQQEPPECHGKGIVIAGGGKYLDWAWVVCKWLRGLGCQLPIQVWYLGAKEMPERAKPLFAELGVETVDACEERQWKSIRILDGWTLKAFAVMNCPWRHVMFCDADTFVQVIPEEIFNHQEVIKTGSLFFSDVGIHHPGEWGYVYFGLFRKRQEMETGQFVCDKSRIWTALRWWMWISEHRKVWDAHLFGDKGWAEMALRVSNVPFIWSQECSWEGWGISQKYNGKELWRHCMAIKRGEHPMFDWMEELFREWKAIYK